MNIQSKPFEVLFQAYWDAGHKLASVTFECTEGILKLHKDAIQELFSQGSEQLKALLAGRDPNAHFAQWPAAVHGSVQKATEIGREYIEAATRVGNELAHVITEQTAALQREWLENLQASLKTVTELEPGAALPRAENADAKSKKLAA